MVSVIFAQKKKQKKPGDSLECLGKAIPLSTPTQDMLWYKSNKNSLYLELFLVQFNSYTVKTEKNSFFL